MTKKGVPSYARANPQRGYGYKSILKILHANPGVVVSRIAELLGVDSFGSVYNQLDKMRTWGMVRRTAIKPVKYFITDWGTKYAEDKKII